MVAVAPPPGALRWCCVDRAVLCSRTEACRCRESKLKARVWRKRRATGMQGGMWKSDMRLGRHLAEEASATEEDGIFKRSDC